MPKALLVYATRTGETQKIAELIAEGLRFSLVDVQVVNANKIKNPEELEGFDALVFGSATYHGEMLQSMKTLLFLAEKAELEGKIGGAFGAFGWSGESPDRIYDTMKNIYRMEMVSSSLRLKSSSLEGGMKAAQDYGKEIAAKLNA
ncbi:MAG: flavodoxin domain-containing protein [Desulfobacterales bacterium]